VSNRFSYYFWLQFGGSQETQQVQSFSKALHLFGWKERERNGPGNLPGLAVLLIGGFLISPHEQQDDQDYSLSNDHSGNFGPASGELKHPSTVTDGGSQAEVDDRSRDLNQVIRQVSREHERKSRQRHGQKHGIKNGEELSLAHGLLLSLSLCIEHTRAGKRAQ
jgi:hypothetical protein